MCGCARSILLVRDGQGERSGAQTRTGEAGAASTARNRCPASRPPVLRQASLIIATGGARKTAAWSSRPNIVGAPEKGPASGQPLPALRSQRDSAPCGRSPPMLSAPSHMAAKSSRLACVSAQTNFHVVAPVAGEHTRSPREHSACPSKVRSAALARQAEGK